ncbi:GntR family transcriptional regulator / MocR family aminotransferase [Pseudoalteromonas denitrificans DSM 6059]|uniref:GntR family transcriptional regulator / MocR family aminotransferase n=2 Tax=Pseudoalteromonas TaxID=53246 RepID=A0A1I1RB34_9GAMM|nr:GntR family transcriptional regulator / MocR family aminotransferase [Pseudoalteromonas denitrificans DSM 6059]
MVFIYSYYGFYWYKDYNQNLFIGYTTLRSLSLNLNTIGKAKYIVIADAIRQAIKQGQVAPAEALPSARKLAEQLKTNRHTIMAAFAELVAEGWVEAKERSGYRVASDLPIQASQSIDKVETSQKQFQWQFVRKGIIQKPIKATDFKYNFAGGQPDLRIFPFDEFRGHFSQACQKPRFDDLSYGDSKGLPELIDQVSTYLRRVRSITNKEIMICNGSQEALYMVSQLLLLPDDKVAVEELGYPPAWAAFRSAGAELVGIKQDDKGILPDHLEQQLKTNTIKLLYLTPLHQYPTTVTLDAARRMKIYQLAAKYKVAIIEDDYDHEFHYKCQPIAPMAADDPVGLVIYISTFSKLMFGGARVGYVAANNELINGLAGYKTLMNHKNNVLIQQTVARWMKEGGFECHLRRMTRIYQKRRDITVEILIHYQKLGLPIQFKSPDGGMALWLDMGKSIFGLKEKLFAKQVYLQTQFEFNLDNGNDAQVAHSSSSRFIRIGFAAMEENELKQGLSIIMSTLYEDNV